MGCTGSKTKKYLEITRAIEFGDPDMEWDGQYPDKEDLRRRKIPADKEHRLNMIRYKQHDNMAELSAIRLKFNDGTQSEWFEDSEGGNDI